MVVLISLFAVSAALICEMPSDYPSSCAPIINLEVIKGLSLDRGDELKAVAVKVAEDNVGLPSVFTIAEAIKEWLVDNNIPGQDGSMYSGGRCSVVCAVDNFVLYECIVSS